MSSIIIVLVDFVSRQWIESFDNHSNFYCESGSSSSYMLHSGTISSWYSDETV